MKTLILAFTLVSMQFVINPAQADDNGKIVDTETAKELFDRGVLFVDVRDAVDYKNGHIPGAIHIDVRKSSSGFKAEFVKVAKKDQEVVFYCRGWGCTRSLTAIILAKSLDFEKLYRFKLGYPSWRSAGYPIEK
jgi:rhodanese-related sulfurtransferase